MGHVKSGFVLQINRNDNIGVIREIDTQTEWIFFLDEVDTKEVRINSFVTFIKDADYEQFVAMDLKINHNLYRKAV